MLELQINGEERSVDASPDTPLLWALRAVLSTRSPSDADIDAAMSGNICRCGTYVRIREAIKQAAGV